MSHYGYFYRVVGWKTDLGKTEIWPLGSAMVHSNKVTVEIPCSLIAISSSINQTRAYPCWSCDPKWMTRGPGTDHEKSAVVCRLCKIREKEPHLLCTEPKCDDKVCFKSGKFCYSSTKLSQKQFKKVNLQWPSHQKNGEKNCIPII